VNSFIALIFAFKLKCLIMLKNLFFIGFLLSVCSCTSKKEILYLQDVEEYANKEITYPNSRIQPNDVLRINVGALIPDSAIPYNKRVNGAGSMNIAVMQLDGYLVAETLTINFPILGILSVAGYSTQEFAEFLRRKLEDEGHLKNPNVDVRLLNAKVTVIGEVNQPGTFNFTEQNITLLQALGYAQDLTINGRREDILVMREEQGVREITHIDLTSSEWLEGPYNFIKPNDVIVVNPNNPKVKTAGFIPSLPALLGVMTVSLSLLILLTN
jgi:polysaccharide export outer membrane protein